MGDPFQDEYPRDGGEDPGAVVLCVGRVMGCDGEDGGKGVSVDDYMESEGGGSASGGGNDDGGVERQGWMVMVTAASTVIGRAVMMVVGLGRLELARKATVRGEKTMERTMLALRPGLLVEVIEKAARTASIVAIAGWILLAVTSSKLRFINKKELVPIGNLPQVV